MIPNEHRAKGAGPLLGASGPGQSGPFGPYGADDLEDGRDGEGSSSVRTPGGGQEPDLEAAVNDRVAQQIAAARARRERQRAQRQALEAARQHGVAARHRAKLARDPDDQPPPDAA